MLYMFACQTKASIPCSQTSEGSRSSFYPLACALWAKSVTKGMNDPSSGPKESKRGVCAFVGIEKMKPWNSPIYCTIHVHLNVYSVVDSLLLRKCILLVVFWTISLLFTLIQIQIEEAVDENAYRITNILAYIRCDIYVCIRLLFVVLFYIIHAVNHLSQFTVPPIYIHSDWGICVSVDSDRQAYNMQMDMMHAN